MKKPSPLLYPGYDPGNPDEFYLPDYFVAERARRMGVPAYRLLSPRYAATVHTVANRAAARDLAYRLGGRAKKPTQEILLVGADGKTPIIMPGAGVTEAAELQELAQAVYERQEKRLREGRPLVDTDELREREGLPPREKFDELFRQALRDRIEEHRKNPVTDPARQPLTPRGNFTVDKPGQNENQTEETDLDHGT